MAHKMYPSHKYSFEDVTDDESDESSCIEDTKDKRIVHFICEECGESGKCSCVEDYIAKYDKSFMEIDNDEVASSCFDPSDEDAIPEKSYEIYKKYANTISVPISDYQKKSVKNRMEHTDASSSVADELSLSEEPQPSTSEEPQPSTSEEPQPSTSEEPLLYFYEPLSSYNHEPAASDEHQPNLLYLYVPSSLAHLFNLCELQSSRSDEHQPSLLDLSQPSSSHAHQFSTSDEDRRSLIDLYRASSSYAHHPSTSDEQQSSSHANEAANEYLDQLLSSYIDQR